MSFNFYILQPLLQEGNESPWWHIGVCDAGLGNKALIGKGKCRVNKAWNGWWDWAVSKTVARVVCMCGGHNNNQQPPPPLAFPPLAKLFLFVCNEMYLTLAGTETPTGSLHRMLETWLSVRVLSECVGIF